MVLFCNLIGTTRFRRWKLTAFPANVTRLSPLPRREPDISTSEMAQQYRQLQVSSPQRSSDTVMQHMCVGEHIWSLYEVSVLKCAQNCLGCLVTCRHLNLMIESLTLVTTYLVKLPQSCVHLGCSCCCNSVSKHGTDLKYL